MIYLINIKTHTGKIKTNLHACIAAFIKHDTCIKFKNPFLMVTMFGLLVTLTESSTFDNWAFFSLLAQFGIDKGEHEALRSIEHSTGVGNEDGPLPDESLCCNKSG